MKTYLRSILTLFVLFASTVVLSAPLYDPGQHYPGGEQACYEGGLYETKWWANPGQSPAKVATVEFAWETPWTPVELASPDCGGGSAGNRAPVADGIARPDFLTGSGTATLCAAGSYDPDGDSLDFRWAQVSNGAPNVTIMNDQSSDATVELTAVPVSTQYHFRVTVSDGELSNSVDVEIVQNPDSGVAVCPIWESDAIYVEGDVATWNGAQWRAYWWTKGEEPGTTGEWGVWRGTTPSGEAVVCDNPDPGAVPNPDPGPDVDPDADPTTVLLSELLAREAELTEFPLMQTVKASIVTADNAIVAAIAPGNPNNPENVLRVENILSDADWDYLFPRRAPEYTYTNFLQSVGKFPAFCDSYSDGRNSDLICRNTLAIMFAHFTQETGGHTTTWPEPQWRQGLFYVRELGWTEDMANGYGICDSSTWQGATWPCGVFPEGHPNAGQSKSYFGRGAKQLSYNYNYGPFSDAMFGDVSVLLNHPELVADTWLNLASAVFFYVYPQPPKPSMLHVVDGTWQPNEYDLANGLVPGFGVTTMIINGGIECGGSTEHAQSQNRIEYYKNHANHLSVKRPPDEVHGCTNMAQFDAQGAVALPIYWEQNWSEANACQLVSYQTAFSALKEGDYVKCVEHHFDVVVDYSS